MDTSQLKAGEMKLQNVCELWGEGLSFFFFLDSLRAEDIGFKMQKSILLSGSHKWRCTQQSTPQETQEMLGILVIIKREDKVNGLFCAFENEFARNTDRESGSFLLLLTSQIELSSFVHDTAISHHWREL